MKPTIRITTVRDKSFSKSFFGGLPKVPPNFQWLYWDATPFYLDEIAYAEKTGREWGNQDYWNQEIEKIRIHLQDPFIPLIFLGQIYLDEVPRFGEFPNLPSSGVLCFFSDLINSPPGFRASSKGSCRVVYVEDTSNLQELSFPEAMVEKYRDIVDDLHPEPCGLSFEPRWVSSRHLDLMFEVPDGAELDFLLNEPLEEIPGDFPERNESTILVKNFSASGKPIHLLLGSPMEIQNPMQEMCQLCFHGFNELDYNIDYDAEVAHLREGVKDWQLLLQLDCDEKLNWEWGDSGMLYFWIRKQDLEKGDFSNVWWEVQCS